MRDIETLLNDYRKGTFEVRLNLFLFHRELRREFSEIEKDDDASLNGHKSGFNLWRKNEAPRSKLRGIRRNYGVANPSSL